MRTRNRGQRTSFVSSLGLCPRKNRRKQVTQHTGLALSGHASRGRRFRKRSMFRSALLLTSGTGKRLKSDRIRGTPTKPTPSPSKPTSLKRMADNPIAPRRPSRAFRGRRGRGSRASTRASIPSCSSRTSVRASTRRTWRRGRKRKFPGLTRPVSFVNRPHSGDVKSEVNTSAIDPQNETVVGILKNQEVHDDTPSLRPRKRPSSRIGSPYICSFYPRRGTRTINNIKAADDAPLSSKPSPPIKQEPFKSLFLNNFQHTPGKRKRGRPSSPAVYLKPPVSSSSVSSGTRSSTRPASVYRSSATIVPSCAAPKHAINSAHPFPATPNPSALLPDDLRSRTGDLKFGSADEVLLEILREVDTNGCVPKVQKHSDLSRSNMAISKDESIFESEASFIFDTPLVATVFDNMLRPTVASLFRLEVKDLFLAINGLVRPGVCDLWRRRREEKTKQLSRSVMGRLRPNPRPRLYSDMVISSNSGHSSSNLHMNVRHAPLESSVLIPDKVRQGSRSVALAAARLTAAKRLIRDRSRRLVGSSSSVLLKRTKRSRTPKVETSPPSSPQIESKKIRAPRSTSKISSQTAINTRGRRRPDVKHHIDWKFCYTNTDQETFPLTSFGTTLSHRRRKTAGSAEVLRSEDAAECQRSSPVLVSEGTLCTDSEEGKSVLEAVEEEAKEHLITPEVALSEVAEDETLEKLELADSQIDASALSFPSGDGRRKRRHALTVQRKRPAGRSVGGFGYREADAWKDKYSLSTKFEDNSSVSSSSISGIPNAFSRVFRQSSWLHGEHSKSSFSKHLKFHGVRPISSALLGESRSTRSLGVHKIQRISASTLAPRRNPLSVRVAPPVSPRQRITRRPDRMCQLTLLDRLVLGLNCSVSRNGGEIHIKQLHAEELNILTQRMNKTGFFIQSLALRTNSHNDAEYNLVLTFSPTAEGVTRRTRCPSSTRSRIASSEHSLDYPSHSFTERIPCRKIRERSRSLKHLRSCLSGIAATKIRPISPRQSSQNTGYVSDSAASLDRPRRRSSATRFVHSDGEESEPVRCPKILHTLNIRKLDAQKPSQWASTGKHNKVATTTIKLDGTGGKWSPRNLDSQTHIESVSSPSNRRPTTSHAERFLVPSEGTSGHRRPAMLAKIRQDRTFVSEPHSGAPSPSVTTGSNSYGTSKRASRAATPVASVLPPFRRHSPRKIIRKVYTGSLTIPKILNRKRPTGGSQPALSVPLCSSSTAVTSVPGLASSSFSQHVPTVVTATPSTSTQLSGVVHSTSSNTMSSVIYEDSNRASPAFSQSLSSSISVQYRRLPTVTSAAVTSETPTLNYSQAGGSPLTLTATSDRGSVELSRLSGAPYSPPHVVSASTAAPNPPPSVTTERELGRITPLTFPDHAAPMQPSPSPYIVSPSLSTTRHTGVADHDSSRDPQMHQINLPAVPATSESPVCASPAVPSVPFPANDQRVQKPLTESSSQPLPINTRSNTGPDLSLDFDDIYTPANSMSASQLLKLKRIHDESGHPFTQTNESRPNQFLSPSGRVQSPSNSARSPQSQLVLVLNQDNCYQILRSLLESQTTPKPEIPEERKRTNQNEVNSLHLNSAPCRQQPSSTAELTFVQSQSL
ncbi:unnamed protein product [Dicrocoelium dendriticum]|nr:unnamed protein product [Dicrocoelium dendriticum]